MKKLNLLNAELNARLIFDLKCVRYDRIFAKYLRHPVIHCLIILVNKNFYSELKNLF